MANGKKIDLRPKRDLLKRPVATKIFTNREKMVNLFAEVLEKQEERGKLIYSFYGVGGIGKTSLCNKFMDLLQSRKEVIGIKIDFENKQFLEPVNFLFEIRKQIAEKDKRFKFPVFDAAFAYYWMKANPNIPLKEKSKELPVVELLVKIADNISPLSVPIFTIAKKTLEISIKSINKLQEIKQKWRTKARVFLTQFMQLRELKDIEEIIPQALSLDLAMNLNRTSKRLFVFVDTLEQLWGEMGEQMGERAHIQDMWLRETVKHTLVECQYQICWFFFSREKIRWEEVDKDLTAYLEQHLIGGLSKEDCKIFLTEAGITDEELQQRIIEVSKGLPFYLDRAVDLYYSILEFEERPPSVEDFPTGEKELIQRFLRYCREEDIKLIKILAVPRIWNEELFKHLMKELNLSIDFIVFKRFINHSFVQELAEKQYSIHQVLREHIYEHYSEHEQDFVKEIHETIIKYYLPLIDFSSAKELTPQKIQYIDEWLYHAAKINLENAVQKFLDQVELLSRGGYYRFVYKILSAFVTQDLSKQLYVSCLNKLGETEFILGFVDEAKKHLLEAYEYYLSQQQETEEFVDIIANLGGIDQLKGNYQKALEYFKKALDVANHIDYKLGKAEVLNNIGMILHSLGKPKEALDNYQQALNIARELDDKSKESVFLNSIGQVLYSWGKYGEALDYYQQALKIAKELGDKVGEAEYLNNIGMIFYSWGKPEEALDNFQQALNIAKELGDKSGEASYLISIGDVFHSWGKPEEASDNFQQALNIARELGNKASEASYLTSIGGVFYFWGKYDKALEYYEQALNIIKSVGDKEKEATILNDIGVVFRSWGDYDKALEYYNEALKIVRELDDKVKEANYLNNIGVVLYSSDKPDKALEYYQQALNIIKSVGDKEKEATILNNIGGLLASLNRYDEALEYYKQALEIAKTIDNKVSEAVYLNNIGRIFDSLNRYDEALEYYKQALEIAKTIGDKANEAAFLNNIAGIADTLGRYDEALEYYKQALEIAKTIGDKTNETTYLNNIGSLLQSMDKLVEALEYYKQALLSVKKLDNKTKHIAILNNIISLLRSMNKLDEALEYYQQALTIVKEMNDKGKEVIMLNNIGLLLRSMNKLDEALEYYQDALIITKELKNKTGDMVIILYNMGSVFELKGEESKALEYYKQALALAKDIGDKTKQLTIMKSMKRILNSRNQ
ncbi:MAG: tetratricopeptide repeat protein [Candidatus Heimdallarchaeaceae archaeon]